MRQHTKRELALPQLWLIAVKDLIHHSSKKRKDEANTSPQIMLDTIQPLTFTATCPAIALTTADAVTKRGWISPSAIKNQSAFKTQLFIFSAEKYNSIQEIAEVF